MMFEDVAPIEAMECDEVEDADEGHLMILIIKDLLSSEALMPRRRKKPYIIIIYEHNCDL